MSSTINMQKLLRCAMMFVVTASLWSCTEQSINTSDETSIRLVKLGQSRNVLPIREIISSKGVLPEDGDYTLAGQITYSVTQTMSSAIDLELCVELELKPPRGENGGWKIGNVSLDRLTLSPESDYTFKKAYLIDESDRTRKLNLIYGINRGELSLRMAWLSRSKFDEPNR